jgi:hypothetical protein
MKLDFYKPTVLPLAGLQHMQQCQVGWNIIINHLFFLNIFDPNEKWSPQWGFEPSTSQL